MKAVLLSFFHPIYGPKALLQAPQIFSDEQVAKVLILIDTVFDKGFFIFKFPDIISANYFFEVPSPWARGKREMVLISLIFPADYKESLAIYEIPLAEFVNKFSQFVDIYMAFYGSDLSKMKHKDQIQAKFEEVTSLVDDLIKVLPVETISVQGKAAKLFIFGLDRAGKTTLLNRIKHNIFIQTAPTLNLNILQILFNNLQIVCFDVAGQKRFRNSWRQFMNATNGLIFVFDSSNFQRTDEARKELWRVFGYEEAQGLPLLILSNKIDLKPHISLDNLTEALNLNELNNRKWKITETSALNNIGVQEGFSWISKQILTNWTQML